MVGRRECPSNWLLTNWLLVLEASTFPHSRQARLGDASGPAALTALPGGFCGPLPGLRSREGWGGGARELPAFSHLRDYTQSYPCKNSSTRLCFPVCLKGLWSVQAFYLQALHPVEVERLGNEFPHPECEAALPAILTFRLRLSPKEMLAFLDVMVQNPTRMVCVCVCVKYLFCFRFH